jgi:chromosome segregation ATPase
VTSADHPDREDEPRGGLVRRVLSYGPSPEERLEQLLAQRRSELDEHAARLHESIAELERREELLRDSRASVERMLRLGTSDLEAREAELTTFVTELTEREKQVSEAEEEVARRRQELGAVELKRASVERRERALETKATELAELATELEERTSQLRQGSESDPTEVELAFVPGERYRLVELEATKLWTGASFELESQSFVVARIGRSPLPADKRRCAYLVLGPRRVEPSSSAGSS